ncbi:toll-like receptor 13 [Ostrea edulis]|uniref:toll-like receptor 13 n=1 Tax=Ostrea edulis TaxID=37623 RepID=UPI002094308C|nr:toll-like receptor 13 [Ostrea edulis]XP_048749233.1 toll-like receptor 13 [Ostrea edulis]
MMISIVLKLTTFSLLTTALDYKDSFCPDTICLCPNNYTADCSYRNLAVVPAGLPIGISVLIITGNSIPVLKKDTFKNVENLKITKLIMNRCDTTDISLGAFDYVRDLLTLDLAFNALNGLNCGFQNLSQLQSLNMSSNNFTQIPPILNSLGKLNELVLRDNRIHTFLSGRLRLNSLQKLDLSSNRIRDFCFQAFPNLLVLNLTDNQIISLAHFCTQDPPKLENLQIAINHLSNTNEFYTYGNRFTSLRHLNISFNPFSLITQNSFSMLSKLKTLHIARLLAYGVNVEEQGLASNSLTELFFGSMILQEMTVEEIRNILKYCPNLLRLDLVNIDFSQFSPDQFVEVLSPLQRLTALSLLHCNIDVVPPLDTFTELSYLDLAFNHIGGLLRDMFSNLKNLKHISFHKNHLTIISESSFPDFIWYGNGVKIDLSNNSFDCSCDLEWFQTWLKNNSQKMIRYPEFYECNAPIKWKGRKVSEYVSYDCHLPSQSLILSFTVLGFLSIFIFIVVLLRKLQWDIKYYFHICKNRKPFNYKTLLSDVNLYDGYVAYNFRDRKWVMSKVVKHLEQMNQYRLCLHERNVLPGGSIVDDIIENIDASRKFILVLSNNFMDDQWCKYEANIANHMLADGKGEKIIILLLEDIQSQHLTSSLKVLLKSTSHVKWTENANGQKLFFKALRRLMDK